MKHEGPALESLLQRLSETPDDFRVESRVRGQGRGTASLPAMIGRLSHALGSPVPTETLTRFACRSERSDRNQLALSLITCWFLAHPWFQCAEISSEQLLDLFEAGLPELAGWGVSSAFIHDPERREGLARFVLAQLGFRPRGETAAEACERLATLADAERRRARLAARWADERASAIRQQLARRISHESADKWTRE